MRKSLWFQTFCCCLLLLTLTACQPPRTQQLQNPAKTTVPTPVATPEPLLLPSGEELSEVFYSQMDLEGILSSYETIISGKENPTSHEQVVQDVDLYRSFCQTIETSLEQAQAQTIAHCREIYPEVEFDVHTSADNNALTWQYIASMMRSIKDADALKSIFDVNITVERTGNAACRLEMQSGTRPFLDALNAVAKSEHTLYMPPRFSMAYLLTVYDDDGQVKDYVFPEVSQTLQDSIQPPLTTAKLRNGWYADRDQGTRRHTGMDMRAPADTPIYSCTDGTVLYVGDLSGTGYYVVVMDDEGYEFHYYHMIRQSDFLKQGQRVKAGDVIGHVGNTGNSDANHLHLTIITPDNLYINPYPLMQIAYDAD